MKKIFNVVIEHKGEIKNLVVNDQELRVGRTYVNNIPLLVNLDSFKLAEIDKASIKLYLNENMDIKLVKGSLVSEIKNLTGFIKTEKFLYLKDDVVIHVYLEDYHFYFFIKKVEEKIPLTIPKHFRQDIIARDNLGFVGLLSIITFFFFFASSILIKYAQKIEFVEIKDHIEKMLQVEYKTSFSEHLKKLSKTSIEEKKIETKAGTKINTSRLEGKGAGGGFFEGPAVINKGVLGVEEGTKNVVINREKSLFHKIDETLREMPIKGQDEISSTPGRIFDYPRKYETVKTDDIYKRDVSTLQGDGRVELEKGQRIHGLKPQKLQIVSGKRPEAEILGVINRHKRGFEFLYIEEHKKDNSLQGKVVLKINISGSGIINLVEILETDINNSNFLDKVVFLMKSIKFPHSEYGDTSVKIPLVFLPN